MSLSTEGTNELGNYTQQVNTSLDETGEVRFKPCLLIPKISNTSDKIGSKGREAYSYSFIELRRFNIT